MQIKHHNPDTPIILVGLKIDLREDKTTLSELAEKGVKPISTAEGQAIGKVCFVSTFCKKKESF